MPDIKSKIDLDIGDVKDRLDEISESIERSMDLMDTWNDNMMDKSDFIKQGWAGIGEAAKDSYKEQATAADETRKKMESIGQAYERTVREMRQERGVKGIVGEMLPQQAQFLGIQNSMQKLKSSVLSELPFGGLIGLMVLGGKREEEVRAMGATVGRIFQQTGQAGRREMGLISRDVRRLGVMLGKGPTGLAGEAASAAAAFAQAGIDIETVVRGKFTEPIKGSRGSILEASMAIDSLFKQASGTAARQMGELVRDFNQSAKESTRIIASIGLAARDSGTSVSAFTGSVMRSAQALRTQRVDIEEVAEVQLRFQKLLKQEMPGVTRQFAAGYAERAIGQVTQGLAGMSVGLSAVIGERISRRAPGITGGQQVTGLEAYYALREGFGGRGQQGEQAGMFAESVRELLNLAQENGRTIEEQRFFLERMGFGFEGAKAILKVGQEAEKSGDLQDAIKNNQQDLNRAFVDRAKETSDFQRALLKIQDGIAKLGAGILGATISGFQSIYYGVQALANIQMPWETKEEKEVRREVAIRMLDKSVQASTRATGMMIEGIQTSFQGAKLGFGTVMGFGAGADPEQVRKRVMKERGLEYEVGGEVMTRGRARMMQTEAREQIHRETLEGIERTLESTSATGIQKRMILQAYRTGESYGKGQGAEDVAKFVEHQRRIGKPIRAAGGAGGMLPIEFAEEEEVSAGKITREMGGKKITLRAITKLQIDKVEDVSQGLPEAP